MKFQESLTEFPRISLIFEYAQEREAESLLSIFLIP